MHLSRGFLWSVIPICCAGLTDAFAAADEAPSGDARNASTAEVLLDKATVSDSTQAGEEPFENTSVISFQAIDQMIDISKRMGDTETAAELQIHRDQSSTDDELQWTIVVANNSYSMAEYLRERGELLSAAQLIPFALQLGEALKNDVPPLFVGAHHEAALLDIEFERYDSALNHMSVALKRVEQGDFERRALLACRANYAGVLRKLQRFDEAEQICLKLIEEAACDPKPLSMDDRTNLRFALAAVYADMGAYRQFYDVLAVVGKEQKDEQLNADPDRAILRNKVYVNHSISVGDDLTLAATTAQELVEWTQESYGVSSRRHIDALELLAKVRVAQNQYDDAVALLKKSADLRAGLLGPDHPSIARLCKEVDAVRKQQLDDTEPIWKPSFQDSDSDDDDRYSLPEAPKDARGRTSPSQVKIVV